MECYPKCFCRKSGWWRGWGLRIRKQEREQNGIKKIILVGIPNVGKSLLFRHLTGTYVTISNYPGTTVEVFRGRGLFGSELFEVIDTPGMYSLLSMTEEERVTRALFFAEHPEIVIHVVDAKNLEKMLPLTLQLLEADLPVILVVNMIDEAEHMGIKVDVAQLEGDLKIPVVATVAARGGGIDVLRERIFSYVVARGLRERIG